AAGSMNGGVDRDRRGVGTASPQRGDSPRRRVDALEAGDDRDFLALLETVDQLRAVDLEYPRRGVGLAGLDRDLPALPGTRLNPEALQDDLGQSVRCACAGSHRGVIFASDL